MKMTLISFFLSTLLYFSSPITQINNYFTVSKDNKDSTLITVPFNVKFGIVSEEYLSEKKIKIDSFYNKFINSPYYSGSFLVAKNGRIIYEDYTGFSNAKTGKKIDANTAIHLASVSKVLTATAILKLVQENNLMLDQKVTDWIPKFPYKNVTIRTLLNHRSGLPHYSNFPSIMKKAWNKKKVLTNNDILDLMVKQKFKPIFAHNARFDYCNTNYVILALIIERATGQNYRDAMQTLIFKPLGMKNTFVFNYETDRDTVSKSYRASTIFPWDQYDNLYGDKNVYSTPRDLVKFDLATYSPDFIKPELLQEAYYGYSAANVPNAIKDYGLGMRMRYLANKEKLVYHNGWWHGNNTSFVPVKKDTVTIICLGNKYSNRPYATLNMASNLFFKKNVEEIPMPAELEIKE